MTARIESGAEWNDLADAVAELYPGSRSELKPDSRLIEDLGFDSLGLAELVVVMMEKYDVAILPRQLEDLTWEGMTLGMLLQKFTDTVPSSARRSFSTTA